jgi:intracellular septation protein
MMQALEVTSLVGAAILLSWLWRPRRAVEPGVRILMISYALLGGWALWFGLFSEPGQEPAWFVFWKPTVMYWILSAILIAAPPLGCGYPVKAVFGTYFVFSNREWRWINLGFAALCALLGSLNLIIAFAYTKDDWDGFKFSCMVNVLAVFLLRLTFVWIDTIVRFAVYLHGRAKTFFQ